MKRRFVPAALALLWIVSVVAAGEEGERAPYLEQSWYLNAGGYLVDFNTDASVGLQSLVGTLIRLEDDLGVEADQSIFRLEGMYRFNERHALEFGYWNVRRDGEKAIERQIEFEDVVYDVGASIRSEADADYLRLGWKFSAVRSNRGEAGISLGLSSFAFEVALEGEGTITPTARGGVTENVRVSESIVAPAPTFGIFMTYAMRPRLLLRGKTDFFKVRVGDIDGSLSETLLGIDWFFSKHVGVGGGLLGTRIDIDDDGEDPYQIRYHQTGFVGYVSATF